MDEEAPTLLEKSTEVEEIAAGVILAKLDKLRQIEEIMSRVRCCDSKYHDAATILEIRAVLSE